MATTFTGRIQTYTLGGRGKDNLKRFFKQVLFPLTILLLPSHTEKSDVRFGLGHTYQKGNVPNTDLNTTNFNLSAYDFI